MTLLTGLLEDAYPELKFRAPAFENGSYIDIIGSTTHPNFMKGVELRAPAHGDESGNDIMDRIADATTFDDPIGHTENQNTVHDVAEYLAPASNGDFVDWVAIFDAVCSGNGPFQMLELGAGYGRWSAIAALAARKINRPVQHLGLFEAEPTHFDWAVEHMKANSIPETVSDVQWAAVGDHVGEANFYIGNPSLWWGQSLAEDDRNTTALPLRMVRKIFPSLDKPMKTVRKVPMTTLKSIIMKLPENTKLDLVHMDVQGAEADVIASSLDIITARVQTLFIGTHGPQTTPTRGRDMPALLREMLSGAGWKNVLDVPPDCLTKLEGEKALFLDGAQIWRNPADTRDHANADQLLRRLHIQFT